MVPRRAVTTVSLSCWDTARLSHSSDCASCSQPSRITTAEESSPTVTNAAISARSRICLVGVRVVTGVGLVSFAMLRRPFL